MKPGFSPDPDRGKRQKLSNVVEHGNPFAVTDVLDRIEHGKYGSVTKDIEALFARRMKVLGPYLAKYPKLNQLIHAVIDRDEEILKSEDQQVTGLTHQNVIDLETPKLEVQQITGLTLQNVIDLEGENTEKDVHAAQIHGLIHIDSDEEDDGDKKSIVPYEASDEDGRDKKIIVPYEASNEEDDRDKKSFVAFHEVVSPRLVAPSPASKTVVSFFLFL